MTGSANVKHFVQPGQAPAVGTSIQVDIGGGAAMVLQTHFAQDAGPAEVDRLLDGMMRAAQRQKAKAEIVVLGKNIETQRKMLADLEFQMAEAEKSHQRQVLASETREAKWREEIAGLQKSGYEQHRKDNKRGDYVPAGAIRSRISSFENQARVEVDARAKLLEEKDKAEQGREIARVSCEREIAANVKLIEERKALIAGV